MKREKLLNYNQNFSREKTVFCKFVAKLKQFGSYLWKYLAKNKGTLVKLAKIIWVLQVSIAKNCLTKSKNWYVMD